MLDRDQLNDYQGGVPADCLLARRNTARLIGQIVEARQYSHDMLGVVRRTIPDYQVNPLRRRSRRAAARLGGVRRQLYLGDSDLIQNRRRYRDFVSVTQLDWFTDDSVAGLAIAVYDLSVGLELLRPRSPDMMRVRDFDMVKSREQLRQLVLAIKDQLDGIHVDASAADLRSGRWNIKLLANVIWTEHTMWMPAIGRAVRARSRELSPGVFQLTSG